jgi:hypothetical membrane protein
MTMHSATSIAAPTNARSSDTSFIVRATTAAGIVTGPAFVLIVLLQAFTREGYDLTRHPVSMLALGDLGWIQSANFILSGVLMVAFAVGLRASRAGTWGPVLVALFGAGLITAGVFVPDPAWNFPPGAPDGIPSQLSTNAMLHGVGFSVAFLGISAACVVFTRRFLATGERMLAAYTLASAATALALSGWPGTDGASIRYFAASVIVWIWTVVLAIRVRSNQA